MKKIIRQLVNWAYGVNISAIMMENIQTVQNFAITINDIALRDEIDKEGIRMDVEKLKEELTR